MAHPHPLIALPCRTARTRTMRRERGIAVPDAATLGLPCRARPREQVVVLPIPQTWITAPAAACPPRCRPPTRTSRDRRRPAPRPDRHRMAHVDVQHPAVMLWEMTLNCDSVRSSGSSNCVPVASFTPRLILSTEAVVQVSSDFGQITSSIPAIASPRPGEDEPMSPTPEHRRCASPATPDRSGSRRRGRQTRSADRRSTRRATSCTCRRRQLPAWPPKPGLTSHTAGSLVRRVCSRP